MRQKLAIALLSFAFTVLLSSASNAETVLERVTRTGTLTAGIRTDSIPFGYIDKDGNWVGYSIDIVGLIQNQLEKKLGKQIRLNLVKVPTFNRAAEIAQGKVDIICGSTSLTGGRQSSVNFSTGYFVTGTQLLVKKGGETGSEFRIGVIPGTTTEQLIKSRLPLATFVSIENRAAGLLALEHNGIDALASDGVLLEGLRHTTDHPEAFQVVPAQPYDREVYACMLPLGDTSFQTVVNDSLIEFMRGVINNNSRDAAILNTWFGETGVAPVDRTQLLNYFQETINAYQQNLEAPQR
jgi:polar amino acid transport system substrate-binding protein